jgi:hypothetical protein
LVFFFFQITAYHVSAAQRPRWAREHITEKRDGEIGYFSPGGGCRKIQKQEPKYPGSLAARLPIP